MACWTAPVADCIGSRFQPLDRIGEGCYGVLNRGIDVEEYERQKNLVHQRRQHRHHHPHRAIRHRQGVAEELRLAIASGANSDEEPGMTKESLTPQDAGSQSVPGSAPVHATAFGDPEMNVPMWGREDPPAAPCIDTGTGCQAPEGERNEAGPWLTVIPNGNGHRTHSIAAVADAHDNASDDDVLVDDSDNNDDNVEEEEQGEKEEEKEEEEWRDTPEEAALVAIKRLRMGVSQPMVLRELSLQRRLRHANIVKLIAVVPREEWEEKVFLVMEYLPLDLRTYLVAFCCPHQSRRSLFLPLPAIKRLLRDTLRGLAFAHARGVVHRDLKPENILVEPTDDRRLRRKHFPRSLTQRETRDVLRQLHCRHCDLESTADRPTPMRERASPSPSPGPTPCATPGCGAESRTATPLRSEAWGPAPQLMLPMAKIGDFGSARLQTLHFENFHEPAPRMTGQVTTKAYRAPEMLLGHPAYSTAVDVWAVGAMFYEFVWGELLVSCGTVGTLRGEVFCEDATDVQFLIALLYQLGSPTTAEWEAMLDPAVFAPSHGYTHLPHVARSCLDAEDLAERIGRDGVDLMKALLRYAPHERISAADALEHPFLRDA